MRSMSGPVDDMRLEKWPAGKLGVCLKVGKNRLATEHAPWLDDVAIEEVKFQEFSAVVCFNLHSLCLGATQFAKPFVMTGTLCELEDQRKITMFMSVC